MTREDRFDLLDGLRAFAALAVLFAHEVDFWTESRKNAFAFDLAKHAGTIAVAVFFAISGFVLYRPFVAARARGFAPATKLRGYGSRRFARIVPAYWLVLLVFGALSVAGAGLNLAPVLGHDWWAYFGFLQIYGYHWSVTGLATAWTLCIEVTFYILLPVYVLAMAKRGAGSPRPHSLRWEMIVLGALAVGSIVFRTVAFTAHPPSVFGTSLAGTFSWFVPGMMLAALVGSRSEGRTMERLRRFAARPGLCLLVSVLAFAGAFAVHRGFPQMPHEPAGAMALEWALYVGVSGPILLLAVLGSRVVVTRKLLGNPVSLWLGQISYGIYLWHYPIAWYLAPSHKIHSLPFHLATPVYAVSVLIATLVPATLSYYLVERPLLRRVASRAARTSPGAKRVVGRLQLARVGD